MVINEVKRLQEFINKAPTFPNFPLLEWDIFLSNVSEFKKDILTNPLIAAGDYKESLVKSNYPKYLWRAIGVISGTRKIEFLFDATDIDQGEFYIKFISYDNTTERFFKIISPLINLTNPKMNMNIKAILESFR